MAAYNGGPGRVGSAVRKMKSSDFWKISSSSRHLRRETRNFVPAILAAAIIMKEPEKYGFGDVVLEPPLEYENVRIDSPTDLRIAAELADVSIETLQELNPALRRMITPDDYDSFELKVPVSTKEIFETRYAALPAHKRLKYTEHIVKPGETLSAIAKRYRTSVTSIQRANNIRNPHKLSRGQHLIIPLSPGAPSAEVGSTRIAVRAVPKGTKVVHTVRRGENLYLIARAYQTTVGSIAAWNNINPSATIHPGNKLTIIAGTIAGGSGVTQVSGNKIVHNVRQGDTLYDIDNRYNISVSQLKRWNNLRRNLIHPGDQLTIYVGNGEGKSN
jgi:membrane-bound lytic murein transglycosylase D